MRAWGDLPGDDPERDRAETTAAIEAAGIDLDPAPPGSHRHGDETHASDHAHPHVHSAPGEPPVIGIVGAGAVGTALGVALTRAGWPIHAVASRDPARRERFRSLVDVPRVFVDPEAILDEVELIILAVPDDAVAPLAGSLRMYSGQAMIHTSGALGAEVLAPAMAAGTQIGAFHPLVAFADTERAVAALHGATVAIEGDDQLAALLADMAEALGAVPVRLAPGSKSAYHAAAVLAAGGFVALLDAIAELGRVAGLDEAGALAIYGPLIEGTLDNARALGIRSALDRADHPRGHRHPPSASRDASIARAWGPRPVRRRGRPRGRHGRSAARPGTGGRDDDARRARVGLARRPRAGTIASHGSQHRGQVRGPPGGSIRPPLDPRPGAPIGTPAVRPIPGAGHAKHHPARTGSGLASTPPSQLARHPAGRRPADSQWPSATVGDHGVGQVRAYRDGPPAGRDVGAVARLRTSTATSAGGIVVRYESGLPWFVVGSRRRERDGRTWTLPKGTPNQGETREQTALREVQEETGLIVRITGELDSIEYWFVQSGTRIHKTVHYFLMEPVGGELADHDHEFDEVRWITFDSAATMLTFETERALVAKAAARLTGADRAGAAS